MKRSIVALVAEITALRAALNQLAASPYEEERKFAAQIEDKVAKIEKTIAILVELNK